MKICILARIIKLIWCVFFFFFIFTTNHQRTTEPPDVPPACAAIMKSPTRVSIPPEPYNPPPRGFVHLPPFRIPVNLCVFCAKYIGQLFALGPTSLCRKFDAKFEWRLCRRNRFSNAATRESTLSVFELVFFYVFLFIFIHS